MTDATSVSLIRRLRNGADEDAWSRFDLVYRAFITRFLCSKNVDDTVTEDVCQSVMTQAYESFTSGRFKHNGRTGALRNWLRQVVISQLALYRRKGRPHEYPLPEGLEQELARDDSRLTRRWDAEHHRAMLELIVTMLREHTSPESLEIFRRTFVEGVDTDQVAAEFGRTKNAVVVVKCKVLKKARTIANGLMD